MIYEHRVVITVPDPFHGDHVENVNEAFDGAWEVNSLSLNELIPLLQERHGVENVGCRATTIQHSSETFASFTDEKFRERLNQLPSISNEVWSAPGVGGVTT